MMKDVIKFDDVKDFNRTVNLFDQATNVNLFDSGLKIGIQRLTIMKLTHLNNKVSKWYNSQLQAMKRES